MSLHKRARTSEPTVVIANVTYTIDDADFEGHYSSTIALLSAVSKAGKDWYHVAWSLVDQDSNDALSILGEACGDCVQFRGCSVDITGHVDEKDLYLCGFNGRRIWNQRVVDFGTSDKLWNGIDVLYKIGISGVPIIGDLIDEVYAILTLHNCTDIGEFSEQGFCIRVTPERDILGNAILTRALLEPHLTRIREYDPRCDLEAALARIGL